MLSCSLRFLLCNLLYVCPLHTFSPTLLPFQNSSVCTVRTLAQPSFTRKLLRFPKCTQDPHRPRQIKVLSSVAFSVALPFCPVPSKRESCTSSTDRAPRHWDHNVRSHGLDQGDGTVDGLGPAASLLVEFNEIKWNRTRRTPKRSSSALVWPCALRDRGIATGGGLHSAHRSGRTL
jgi:hypothetical protein